VSKRGGGCRTKDIMLGRKMGRPSKNRTPKSFRLPQMVRFSRRGRQIYLRKVEGMVHSISVTRKIRTNRLRQGESAEWGKQDDRPDS